MFNFTVEKKTEHGRLATLSCPHGEVKTPAFIFCATKGVMKALTAKQLHDAQTQIILSNTYHLMLQPGKDNVEKLGGLQKMTAWHGPMLTDSGGFQIFSLGHGSVADEIKGRRNQNRGKTLLEINEEGARFRSYVNGSEYFLTPEESINVQQKLGADFIVVLDECTPFHVDKSYTQKSMEMSHRWALRSQAEWLKGDTDKQKLYGIVQGGIYNDLRQIGCDFINSNDFFGIAVGGSLGADKSQMYDVVGFTMDKLRKDKPVHLLGIGGLKDIFSCVPFGIDTFDCVHPTRLARHGGALVKPSNKYFQQREHINLMNANFSGNTDSIDNTCPCETCTNYSLGYIQHLLKAKELTAQILLSIHNIHFMNNMMKDIRTSILKNTFKSCQLDWLGY